MSNKRAIKFIRFLENAWIVIGVTSAGIGAYETFMTGFEQSYMFFIFAFVSGILYSLRRKQRIRMEADSEDEESRD